MRICPPRGVSSVTDGGGVAGRGGRGRAVGGVGATRRWTRGTTTSAARSTSFLSPSRTAHRVSLPVPSPFSSSRSRSRSRSTRRTTTTTTTTTTTALYNVVVTGGTKGAGKAIALKFLSLGDNVVICSRDPARVASTVSELEATLPPGAPNRILGMPADVSNPSDMTSLAAFATASFPTIDLWVNNAGTNAYSFKPFFDQDDSDIASVVNTNILGVMYGTKAAINAMKSQPTGGHIFNMDGAGADGTATPRFAAYGATKRSLDQLNKSIRADLSIAKIDTVGIHAISPGMVTTELLMAGGDNRFSRLMINCLAETPEDVASFLVPKMREVPGRWKERGWLPRVVQGEYIRFLTKGKAYGQILRRLVLGERKDRFVIEEEEEKEKEKEKKKEEAP